MKRLTKERRKERKRVKIQLPVISTGTYQDRIIVRKEVELADLRH